MASQYQMKYPVPEGFTDILHDFIKEVLHEQPKDILQFGFQYFDSRLDRPIEYQKYQAPSSNYQYSINPEYVCEDVSKSRLQRYRQSAIGLEKERVTKENARSISKERMGGYRKSAISGMSQKHSQSKSQNKSEQDVIQDIANKRVNYHMRQSLVKVNENGKQERVRSLSKERLSHIYNAALKQCS